MKFNADSKSELGKIWCPYSSLSTKLPFQSKNCATLELINLMITKEKMLWSVIKLSQLRKCMKVSMDHLFVDTGA